MHVVVTGAAGNLGSKARAMLERADWCERITAIDVVEGYATGPKTTVVVADLTDPYDARWIEPVRAANGAVHYASANPAPTSSWAQSAKSFDMTANLLEQLGGDRPARFVFASSNHAMGGYKDEPLPPGGWKVIKFAPPSALAIPSAIARMIAFCSSLSMPRSPPRIQITPFSL